MDFEENSLQSPMVTHYLFQLITPLSDIETRGRYGFRADQQSPGVR
jgi:hypothetical protein